MFRLNMHILGGVSIEGDSDSWDFGQGAGFYLDATEPKWKKHYRMYSYVVKELPALVHGQLPIVRFYNLFQMGNCLCNDVNFVG